MKKIFILFIYKVLTLYKIELILTFINNLKKNYEIIF
jgi:hypothetical protein